MFQIDLTPAVITLLSLMVAAMAVAVIALRGPVQAVRRRSEPRELDPLPLPPASVIVYAHDDDHNLRTLLTQVLCQQYDAPLEVIVVNDGTPQRAQEIVADLQRWFPNLYMTSVPDGSRNLSRKKMAITLGIKASKGEALVLTCASCRIASPRWLQLMARPLARGKQIVIGYARPTGKMMEQEGAEPEQLEELYDNAFSPLPASVAFDDLWGSLSYLGAAIDHRPYRGSEYNLAYMRELFFKNNGFSNHLNLNHGDDDIFVSQVATDDNCAAVTTEDARVYAPSDDPAKAHRTRRLRYLFTRRFLRRQAPAALPVSALGWWTTVAAAIALSLAGLPSLLPLCVAAGLLAICYLLLAVTWREAMTTLGQPTTRAVALAPWRMLMHPFTSLRYLMAARRGRDSNYTWKQNN